jgi:hypothetical protein
MDEIKLRRIQLFIRISRCQVVSIMVDIAAGRTPFEISSRTQPLRQLVLLVVNVLGYYWPMRTGNEFAAARHTLTF